LPKHERNTEYDFLRIHQNINQRKSEGIILIPQALGGFTASYRYHKFNNADFSKGTMDRKIAAILIWLYRQEKIP
jgi:hypothetical protein